MNLRCFYCQTPFTLSTEEKITALRKMHDEDLHHYDAHCPRCGRANPVSRERLEMFTPGWETAIKEPVAGAAAELPPHLWHQEGHVQHVHLVRQDVVLEVVVKHHDGVVGERAANQPRGAGAGPVLFHGGGRGGFEGRVIGQAEVIVGGEVEESLAVDLDAGGLGGVHAAQFAIQTLLPQINQARGQVLIESFHGRQQ